MSQSWHIPSPGFAHADPQAPKEPGVFLDQFFLGIHRHRYVRTHVTQAPQGPLLRVTAWSSGSMTPQTSRLEERDCFGAPDALILSKEDAQAFIDVLTKFVNAGTTPQPAKAKADPLAPMTTGAHHP